MPLRRLLPVLVLSPLLLAAPASAAEFCVATTTPCSVPLHNVPTLAAAMAAADNIDGADTVRVGPGEHPGPFVWSGGGELTITGEGIGTTVLTSTTNQVLGGIGGLVTVRDLTVRASEAAGSTGVNLAGGALERVRVEGGNRAVLVTGGGTLDEVEIDTRAGTALRVNGGSPTIRRSRIAGGVYASDEDFTLVDTRVERDGIDGGGPAANVTLRNVLIAVDGPQEAGLRLGNGAVDADHLTIVHRGGAAPGTPGVHAAPGAAITLESSIVSGFPVSLRREASDGPVGPTDLLVRRSSYAFDRVVDVPGSSGGVIDLGPGNVDAESGFVGAGDFRLRGDAPQVDRGALTGITALELGGFARTVDGDGDGEAHTDMGAFEYRRLAPAVTLQAPATAVAGQPVTFTAAATDPDGEPLAYAWSFGASGASATAAFDAGPQPVTVTVTDAGGRTATASATVTVTAPPAPTPSSGGESGPAAPTGPPADTTKPALTVKLTQRRFTPSAVTPKRLSGGALRVTLSERARVTLTLERKAQRRWVAVPGARSLDLPAGTSAVRFRGGVGRKRSPGRYRLVATPVDAAGNRGTTRRLDFRLVQPRG